jgi:hypothetical protein
MVRAATPIKKTRRNKQSNVHVRFSPETRGDDARGAGDENNEGQRQQREGNQERDSEKNGTVKAKHHHLTKREITNIRNHKFMPNLFTPLTKELTDGDTALASIQQHNKQDEKEGAP